MAIIYTASTGQSFQDLRKLVSYLGLVRSANFKIIVSDDSAPATKDKYIFSGSIAAGGFFYFPSSTSMQELIDLGDMFILGIKTDQNLEITIKQANEDNINMVLSTETISYTPTSLPISRDINFKYIQISVKNLATVAASVTIALTLIP